MKQIYCTIAPFTLRVQWHFPNTRTVSIIQIIITIIIVIYYIIIVSYILYHYYPYYQISHEISEGKNYKKCVQFFRVIPVLYL